MTEHNWTPSQAEHGTVRIGERTYEAVRYPDGRMDFFPHANAAVAHVTVPWVRESFEPREES